MDIKLGMVMWVKRLPPLPALSAKKTYSFLCSYINTQDFKSTNGCTISNCIESFLEGDKVARHKWRECLGTSLARFWLFWLPTVVPLPPDASFFRALRVIASQAVAGCSVL